VNYLIRKKAFAKKNHIIIFLTSIMFKAVL